MTRTSRRKIAIACLIISAAIILASIAIPQIAHADIAAAGSIAGALAYLRSSRTHRR